MGLPLPDSGYGLRYTTTPSLQTVVLLLDLAELLVGGGFALATDWVAPEARVRHLSEVHAVR